MEQAQVIEKIRKLLALSTSNHPAEAAAAKAQALLQQYNLERAQVEEKRASGPLYLKQLVDLESRQQWRRVLLAVVAQAHFCQALDFRGTTRSVLIGERHNLEVVEYLFAYLVGQLERMATAAYRQSGSLVPALTWKDAFYLGAIHSLQQRFQQQQQAFQASSDASRALVVVKDAELAEAVRHFYPHTRQGRAKPVKSTGGYAQGVQAGKDMSLSPAVQPPGADTRRLSGR